MLWNTSKPSKLATSAKAQKMVVVANARLPASQLAKPHAALLTSSAKNVLRNNFKLRILRRYALWFNGFPYV